METEILPTWKILEQNLKIRTYQEMMHAYYYPEAESGRRAVGCAPGCPSRNILKQVLDSQQGGFERKVELVKVSAYDLWEDKEGRPGSYRDFYRVADEKFGLILCNQCLGPYLRESYRDQPENEKLLIASSSIIYNREEYIFDVSNGVQLGVMLTRNLHRDFDFGYWIFEKRQIEEDYADE